MSRERKRSGRRPKGSRLPKKVITIIVEGETEFHYLSDLKKDRDYRFTKKPELPSTTGIDEICKRAISEAEQGVDSIFCVMDFDVVKNKPHLIRKIEGIKKKYPNVVFFETSPCIEYWFFLHFMDYFSSKEYSTAEVIRALKEELKRHSCRKDKPWKGIYNQFLKERMSKAISHATHAHALKEKGGCDPSYTKLHLLIEKLEELKNPL